MLLILSLYSMLISLINGQIHLNRSNLAQTCNCDYNSNRIYLNSTKILSIDVNSFQGLSNLQWLYLNGNQLSSISSNTFQSLSNLQWIYLNNNQFDFRWIYVSNCMMRILFRIFQLIYKSGWYGRI